VGLSKLVALVEITKSFFRGRLPSACIFFKVREKMGEPTIKHSCVAWDSQFRLRGTANRLFRLFECRANMSPSGGVRSLRVVCTY
jgi:hypothetical protein